jgi:hypothetical protein
MLCSGATIHAIHLLTSRSTNTAKFSSSLV